MIKKLLDLKDRILETGLDIGSKLTEEVFSRTTRLLEQWGPVLWDRVSSLVPEETVEVRETEISIQKPDTSEVKLEPPEEEESVDDEEIPLNAPPEEDSFDLIPSLEKIPYSKLKNAFSRDQMLKILYAMARSEQEWLSPREISDHCEVYQFSVLPGNVRKALHNKGLENKLISSRLRKNGKRNAKEYRMTEAGIAYLRENLLSK
ncbi:MAG: hypothetical protein JXR95_12670 [Deltaproteobacteria bacterium]|nr:hypothetical protein [Deltaproteobacteria bacterium]